MYVCTYSRASVYNGGATVVRSLSQSTNNGYNEKLQFI